MEEYLAFVDKIGRTVDGKYIYRLDFSMDIDSVWGDYFNEAPSGIIPSLQPDKKTLSSTCRANFNNELSLAKKSYCFSMQDCIDGILPLCFSELSDESMMKDDKPFSLKFGEEKKTVIGKLKSMDIETYDFEEVEQDDEHDALDSLIEEGEEEK